MIDANTWLRLVAQRDDDWAEGHFVSQPSTTFPGAVNEPGRVAHTDGAAFTEQQVCDYDGCTAQ